MNTKFRHLYSRKGKYVGCAGRLAVEIIAKWTRNNKMPDLCFLIEGDPSYTKFSELVWQSKILRSLFCEK